MAAYRVQFLETAINDLKKLAKKYPKVKHDIDQALQEIRTNPTLGTEPIRGFRKLRVKSSDIPGGKRKGFRLFYIICDAQSRILVCFVYAKPRKTDLPPHELAERMTRQHKPINVPLTELAEWICGNAPE